MQHERIDQGVDDQVVLALGLVDEAAAVVEVDRRPAGRRRAGSGWWSRPISLMTRVDLDGVDVLGAASPGRAATSLPEPAPMISTSPNGLAPGVAVEQVRQHVRGAAGRRSAPSPGGGCCSRGSMPFRGLILRPCNRATRSTSSARSGSQVARGPRHQSRPCSPQHARARQRALERPEPLGEAQHRGQPDRRTRPRRQRGATTIRPKAAIPARLPRMSTV